MGIFSEFLENIVDTSLSVAESIENKFDAMLGADDDNDSTNSTTASENNDTPADGEVASRTFDPGPYPTSIANEGDPAIYYTKEIESIGYFKKGKDGKPTTENITDGNRPYSVFNKYSLMNFKGTIGQTKDTGGVNIEQFNKIDQSTLVNPTATKIIQITDEMGTDNLGYRYNYGDFALAKYFGKIPNNQMLTLRRFPFPCADDIISPKELGKDGKPVVTSSPDIARAITWMGEKTENNIKEILGFKLGFNWEDVESKVQELQSKSGARSGTFGAFINESPIASAAVGAIQGKNAVDIASQKANAGYDSFKETYPNHVFGPLNVIKNINMRKQGLKFEHSFTLKFEYELRSLGGANPKIMMMDQLSNILALTYNNAPFWGGSTRWTGSGSVAQPLGDLDKLKNGDISGFFGSVVSDVKGMFSGQSFGEILGKGLKNVIGGKLMEMMNTPQGGQAVAAFLSGNPTGQWHLTIGNPLNPMAVIGNLCCENTDISFEGPLGIQDFPEKMVVSITLKPGRPRDKSDIESMFNCGKGRFYLQPKEGVDVDAVKDVDVYGRAMGNPATVKEFMKITNG
jgi:hypothetical protein